MTQVNVIDALQDAGERTLDTVVGGGANLFDAARRPRRSTNRAARRGAEANQVIAKRSEQTIDAAIALPERLLTQYLRGVRRRAARKDALGLAARTVLSAVNAPASSAAGFFTRIERVTELPHRAPRSTAKTEARAAGRRAVGQARRATTTRRGPGRPAGSRSGAARGTGRGRRIQRRSA